MLIPGSQWFHQLFWADYSLLSYHNNSLLNFGQGEIWWQNKITSKDGETTVTAAWLTNMTMFVEAHAYAYFARLVCCQLFGIAALQVIFQFSPFCFSCPVVFTFDLLANAVRGTCYTSSASHPLLKMSFLVYKNHASPKIGRGHHGHVV